MGINKPKIRQLQNRINRKELKKRLEESNEKRITLSYYKYFNIINPQLFRDHLFYLYQQVGVLGRIYVAREGVNAQISVPEVQWDAFLEEHNSIDFFNGMRLNIAVEADGKSFFTLTIKVREKIVADGISDPDFDPSNTGIHLDAENWNRMASDPNTVIVDMRNHYESEVGRFKDAILPEVTTFREELPWVAEHLAEHRDKNILMYCTGGIRCEKASAYMKYRGFTNVFQLEGGIIEYARQVKKIGLENIFMGKNFVFDERLGERISPDIIAHCHQCSLPADTHTNCRNEYCHLLFIQCEKCQQEYQGCCSEKCRDFMELPETERKHLGKTEVFNGTRFGKGAYRAFKPQPS